MCGLYIAANNSLDMMTVEGKADVFYTVPYIKSIRPEFINSEVTAV